jgi:hypothetical protein
MEGDRPEALPLSAWRRGAEPVRMYRFTARSTGPLACLSTML